MCTFRFVLLCCSAVVDKTAQFVARNGETAWPSWLSPGLRIRSSCSALRRCLYAGPALLVVRLPVLAVRSRAGTDFEKRILANEANNQKFNFLKDGDPYNAYYRQKVCGPCGFGLLRHARHSFLSISLQQCCS